MRPFTLAFLLSAGTSAVHAGSIPRTIVQTSKDSTIDRPDWLVYQNSLRDVNPDFELIHYSDQEALAFIAEHYSGTILEHVYDAATPILRADLFRLAYIYKLGGFYMDMDVLCKSPLDPLADAIDGGEYQAVFPKEWWTSDESYRNIFHGRGPVDEEDHWQVGQYAFAAVQGHPFVKDALEEATVRVAKLMRDKDAGEMRNVDILGATGPHMMTELYHVGRKEGRYGDVFHLAGDMAKPVHERSHGGPDWHKFGPYAEHMLSHTWTKPERQSVKTSSEYGMSDSEYGMYDSEYGMYDSEYGMFVAQAHSEDDRSEGNGQDHSDSDHGYDQDKEGGFFAGVMSLLKFAL